MMGQLINVVITVLSALVVFILVFLPLEFKITEIWMLTPKVSPIISSLFLLILIILFGLINWQKIASNRIFWIFFVIILIVGGLVFNEYRQRKIALEYLPKIYSVDREWGIQAQRVRIKGMNFFPVWKKGKVIIGDQEMLIRLWDEKLIVAEQQVPTKFSWFDLYIVRSDGEQSNKVLFEIKNPNKLGY